MGWGFATYSDGTHASPETSSGGFCLSPPAVSVVLTIPRNKFGGITESIGHVRLRFSRDSIFDDLLTRTWVRLGPGSLFSYASARRSPDTTFPWANPKDLIQAPRVSRVLPEDSVGEEGTDLPDALWSARQPVTPDSPDPSSWWVCGSMHLAFGDLSNPVNCWEKALRLWSHRERVEHTQQATGKTSKEGQRPL